MEEELHCLHKECAVEIKLEGQTSCFITGDVNEWGRIWMM
jgi:hypothetical protein